MLQTTLMTMIVVMIDDGLEAEIHHTAGVDFGDDVKNAIDDVYGVNFVVPIPGAPDGWMPPGPPEG